VREPIEANTLYLNDDDGGLLALYDQSERAFKVAFDIALLTADHRESSCNE